MILPDHRQIRAARALLDWDQAQLASAAGVSKSVVVRVESSSEGARAGNLRLILEALGRAGIEFIEGGVRVRGAVS